MNFCAYRKVRALAMLGFGSDQAYALPRRELAPTRVLKNWPQGHTFFGLIGCHTNWRHSCM
jgi:hypothetical protein